MFSILNKIKSFIKNDTKSNIDTEVIIVNTEVITCPITQSIFLVPVILYDDGNTYEKEAIDEWFTKKSTSPLTNIIVKKQYILNRLIKTIVDQQIEDRPELKTLQYKRKSFEKKVPSTYFDNKKCDVDQYELSTFEQILAHLTIFISVGALFYYIDTNCVNYSRNINLEIGTK